MGRDWTARYRKCGRAFEKECPGLMFLDMKESALLPRHQVLAPRGSESKIMECPCLDSHVHIEQLRFVRVK